MGWFDWLPWVKKEEDNSLLPDIVRVPTDPAFADIITEYKTRRDSERIGLSLVGGGAKGRWQAGVLAYAEQIGVLELFDLLAGTSVGGLNATLLGRYWGDAPGNHVKDVWRGVKKNTNVYTGKMPAGVIDGLRGALGGRITAPGWLDNAPLVALCEKHLKGYTKFAIEVYTVTTQYVQSAILVWGPGSDAVDMAVSTSAVPLAFPAWKGLYMDGGCVMNAPHPFLLDKGATKILVLYCDPDPKTGSGTGRPAPTTMTTGESALAALFSVQEMAAYEHLEMTRELRELRGESIIEVEHFYPANPTGTLLDFETNHQILQEGYDLAVKYMTPEKVRAFLKP